MPRTSFRPSEACRALGLALGAALLWAFFVGWLSERQPDHVDELGYTPDGAFHVTRANVRGGPVGTTYYKLIGGRLEPEPTKVVRSLKPLYAHLAPSISHQIGDLDEYRVARVIDPGSGALWHFVIDRPSGANRPGCGYFVHFDPETRRPARYLGRAGELAARPATDQMFVLGDLWYSSPLANVLVTGANPDWSGRESQNYLTAPTNESDTYSPWRVALVTDDQVVEVDLKAGTTRPLPETDELVALQSGYEMLTWAPDKHLVSVHVAYGRTRASVFRMDPFTMAVQSFPLPESLADAWVGIGVIAPDQAVLLIQHDRPGVGRQDVARLSADGTLSDRVDGVIPADARSAWSPRVESLLMAAMIPTPALGLPIEYLRLAEVRAVPPDKIVGVLGPVAVVMALFGAIAAVLGELWTRRFGHTGHPLWWIFLFLFGLPGLLGYILHRKWPVRVAVTAPARSGLEVFAT